MDSIMTLVVGGIAPDNAIMRFVVSLLGASLLIFILRALGVFGKK